MRAPVRTANECAAERGADSAARRPYQPSDRHIQLHPSTGFHFRVFRVFRGSKSVCLKSGARLSQPQHARACFCSEKSGGILLLHALRLRQPRSIFEARSEFFES
jgi:hypothetical protein